MASFGLIRELAEVERQVRRNVQEALHALSVIAALATEPDRIDVNLIKEQADKAMVALKAITGDH